MSDKELLDMVQERGIQIWPTRKSKNGPVMNWYAQNVFPFIQSYGGTVREALTKLEKAIRES